MTMQSSPEGDPELQWRYERKFIAQGLSVPSVLGLIRGHPAMFREAYPRRTINNVYFDSPQLHAYHDHVSGAAQRVKTRIRWYGPLHGTIAKPVLERKIKCGLVNGKSSRGLPPLPLNGSINREALATALDQAGLPEWLQARMRHLEPVLINRYERHYLQSADRRFRVTVDTGLEFFRATNSTRAYVLPPAPGNLVILELKFGVQHADQAGAVVNLLPFRLNRCSKYVLGIEHLHGV